jgi:hypothetical protein
VASYEDGKKTVFVVGGDVVTRYKYKEYTNPKSKGTTMIQSNTALDPRDLYTAQSGDHLNIWYTTSTSAVYYYSTTTKSAATGDLIQLLPKGRGGQISHLLSSNNAKSVMVKTLVSVDEGGNLTILQQASDTGMWEAHPFYITSYRHNMEIDCFTLRIAAHSDSAAPDQNPQRCSLHMMTSGYVRALLNGTTITLDEKGAWFDADETGVVTLILPTADLACHTLRVTGFRARNRSEISVDVELLNPSRKLNGKLAKIKTGKDLLNAKTQSGEQLIEPRTLTETEADYAASLLCQLNDEQIRLEQKEREKYAKKNASLSITEEEVVTALEDAGTPSGESDKTSPWDFFHIIYTEVKKIEYYELHPVGVYC